MSEVKHKKCFKCGETKPLSDFYKHPKMADGHVNKCKECNKKDVRENRSKNIEYFREYDRERSKDHTSMRYMKRMGFRVNRINYGFVDPSLKKKANYAVSNAIRDNRLFRPNYCEHCGREGPPEAHHPSYAEDMRLSVIWLCTSCHGVVHQLYE